MIENIWQKRFIKKVVITIQKEVKSLVKGLDILEVFSFDKPELSLAEISNSLQLNKSTIHRLLQTLLSKGYVKQNLYTQKYSLGFKLFYFGYIVADQIDLRKAAHGPMKDLNEQSDETIALFISDGTNRICVECIPCNHLIRPIIQAGQTFHLKKGAPSKVFFLGKDKSSVYQALSRYGSSESEIEKFIEDLEQGRKVGYFVSMNETIEGSFSIAAPIIDFNGNVCASLALTGPINRFDKLKESSMGKKVVETAKNISRNIGAKGF